MSLTHSPDMHKSLIARIPFETGRELSEWFTHLESGPPSSAAKSAPTGSPTSTASATATPRPSSASTKFAAASGSSALSLFSILVNVPAIVHLQLHLQAQMHRR